MSEKEPFEKVIMQSSNFKTDYLFNYTLSLSDLMLIEGFDIQDIKNVEKHLYANGMDVYKDGWEAITCKHRNLQNKVVDGIRFHGCIRLDREWVQKGVMSAEDIIHNCQDKSLADELKVMNQHGTGKVDRVTNKI